MAKCCPSFPIFVDPHLLSFMSLGVKHAWDHRPAGEHWVMSFCQLWDGSRGYGSTTSTLPRWNFSASSVRHTHTGRAEYSVYLQFIISAPTACWWVSTGQALWYLRICSDVIRQIPGHALCHNIPPATCTGSFRVCDMLEGLEAVLPDLTDKKYPPPRYLKNSQGINFYLLIFINFIYFLSHPFVSTVKFIHLSAFSHLVMVPPPSCFILVVTCL